jgi:sec-independent protein translocase protein TatA
MLTTGEWRTCFSSLTGRCSETTARRLIFKTCQSRIPMIEGLFQPMHLLVIVAVALLMFGPKKLPELGKGIGEGIRGFKAAINGHEQSSADNQTNANTGE